MGCGRAGGTSGRRRGAVFGGRACRDRAVQATDRSSGPARGRAAAVSPGALTRARLTQRGAHAVLTLRPIAPVLTMSLDWRRNLRMIGQALDKLVLAERLIADGDEVLHIAVRRDGLPRRACRLDVLA